MNKTIQSLEQMKIGTVCNLVVPYDNKKIEYTYAYVGIKDGRYRFYDVDGFINTYSKNEIVKRGILINYNTIEEEKDKILNRVKDFSVFNEKNIYTVNSLEDLLCNLDSEYREALAKALMNLKYINDTPLKLSLGTESQQELLDRVYNQPIKAVQMQEIIDYIDSKMKGDYQYGAFRRITSNFVNKDDLELSMDEEFE